MDTSGHSHIPLGSGTGIEGSSSPSGSAHAPPTGMVVRIRPARSYPDFRKSTGPDPLFPRTVWVEFDKDSGDLPPGWLTAPLATYQAQEARKKRLVSWAEANPGRRGTLRPRLSHSIIDGLTLNGSRLHTQPLVDAALNPVGPENGSADVIGGGGGREPCLPESLTSGEKRDPTLSLGIASGSGHGTVGRHRSLSGLGR
ncbi:hypothetical protein P7C70_g7572, partial [Phenoliferia sp. Uapishka_3]